MEYCFGALKSHKGRHPMWPYLFNPYNRNRPTHLLDKKLFNTMIGVFPHDCGLVLDHLFIGCIDAPEFIPMGSTECIRTVGGYEREEYRNLPRGTEDWKARAKAEYETAKMLKKMLDELED